MYVYLAARASGGDVTDEYKVFFEDNLDLAQDWASENLDVVVDIGDDAVVTTYEWEEEDGWWGLYDLYFEDYVSEVWVQRMEVI